MIISVSIWGRLGVNIYEISILRLRLEHTLQRPCHIVPNINVHAKCFPSGN